MANFDLSEMLQDPAFLPALVEAVEAYRPAINEGIKLLQSFGPEFKSLFTSIGMGIVELKTAMILAYVDKGFTVDQAIILVQDSFASITQAINNRKS